LPPPAPPSEPGSDPFPFRVSNIPEAPPRFDTMPAEAPMANRSELPLAPAARVADPPQGRDELLARLRTRGQALEPSAIQRILEQRKREA
jgi:hypothetical protein